MYNSSQIFNKRREDILQRMSTLSQISSLGDASGPFMKEEPACLPVLLRLKRVLIFPSRLQNKEKCFSKHVNTVNTSQHSINLKQHLSTLSSVVHNLSQKANIFFYNVNTVNMGNMLQQNSQKKEKLFLALCSKQRIPQSISQGAQTISKGARTISPGAQNIPMGAQYSM